MPPSRSTVHLPRWMHAQLLEQAERLHRTKGWLIVRAWKAAYWSILQLPTFPTELKSAPRDLAETDARLLISKDEKVLDDPGE